MEIMQILFDIKYHLFTHKAGTLQPVCFPKKSFHPISINRVSCLFPYEKCHPGRAGGANENSAYLK